MLKGKELLDFTLNKINRKNKLYAISELASQLLNFDEKHKMLLCLANKIDAYEYLVKEILALENFDDIIRQYLEQHDYPVPIRWGWKEVRYQDGKEKIVDYCEWFEDKHQCYCSMWEQAKYHLENAADMSSIEHPLVVMSGDEWVKFESQGVTELYTIYEIE